MVTKRVSESLKAGIRKLKAGIRELKAGIGEPHWDGSTGTAPLLAATSTMMEDSPDWDSPTGTAQQDGTKV